MIQKVIVYMLGLIGLYLLLKNGNEVNAILKTTFAGTGDLAQTLQGRG